ncbi:hypothetical protein GCM10010990_35800 [Croceicoccus mobilis]|uniref:Uncharacterized protein n=1 Tax=Croceicoccus mobilis TaxID=1703339 RepID=A0A916ZA98_9SPHN|nr:hypothetical protein GCM10010990_35800 [Croceicoccus mobilis]
MLALGSAAGVVGILVLRLSWGLQARSAWHNLAGWGAIALSLLCGAGSAGAWGIAVAALWAMAAAFACLGWAAITTPPKRGRAPNRRAGMLPEGGEPLRLGERFLTFALVAVLSFGSAIAMALLLRWIALLCGAAEANATVIALFTAPLAWTVLAYALLMTASRRRQFALIGATMAAALPPVLAGGLS